jgi:hypothetical protein
MNKMNMELPEFKYLNSGRQTQISLDILSLIENVEGNTIKKIKQILKIVKSLKRTRFNINEFRKRTAIEIIESGYVTGCTDAALAYIVIARVAGIPTKYVETISEEWFNKKTQQISGHIFSQSFSEEKGEWIWVDPMRSKIVKNIKGMVIFKEGLDSWDIGITDFNSLENCESLF